ncbi:hypothetical protein ABL78_4143 [Leptomonas seymouri]|uniref:Uncharacterized protein n=1 Tax=Leptomonas seymouri TaxID=5684 RepID=A0A0N1HYM6_LEPSE|nr:hypothetical protein ABL78_4143 [Leptomonas seymouri]|eukprot:KPI86774.1 hypothetical protein ABL78_4143 [Leptomonas seymouri]
MSNKAELAALMASNGDYEKKISLLKRAVVTVTKQKQEVESRQTQLQEELRTSTQHLMEVQRENTVLRQKVKTLETQLEQERSSGSAFGQNMLKGLSSIMGSNDAGGRGGGGGGRGGGRGGRGGSGPQLALSAEDVERLVTENEQLHREKYTYKTKLEDTQRTSAKDMANLKAEVAQLQKELGELHSTLDTVTGRCDQLNADYLVERALADFCRHFFVVALSNNKERLALQGGVEMVAELRWPTASRTQQRESSLPPSSRSAFQVESLPLGNCPASCSGAMPVEVKEQVVHALQSSCGTVKTLLRAISVLIVALREKLPRGERATVSDLDCLRDRLSVFLDAHAIRKDCLMSLLESFEAYLANLLEPRDGAAEGGDVLTAETLVEAQVEVLQLFLEWVGLLRAQTPLLVESCASYLPPNQTYNLRVGRSEEAHYREGAVQPATTTDRAEFVEEMTKYGYATLASVEGALTAVQVLIQRSPEAYYSSLRAVDAEGGVSPNRSLESKADESANEANSSPPAALSHAMDVCTLLALQRFWWEGCASVRVLRTSVRGLDSGIQDLAEGCNKSEVRDTLQYLSKCLRSLIAASIDTELIGEGAEAVMEAEQPIRYLYGCGTCCVPGGASQQLPSRSPSCATAAANGLGHDSRFFLSSSSAEAYEEILVALAAADRAAVAYYTQMNYLYREMADKEDALQTAAEAVQEMKRLLEMERAESEHTRQTMQTQISVLSNQLIEMADTAQAQQLSRLH